MQADAKACKRKSRQVAAKGQGQAAMSRQTSPKGGKGQSLGGFSVVSSSFVGVCAKALCRFWLGCRLCLLLPFTPCRRHPAFAVALPLHSARISAFLPLCIPLAFGFHPLHHPLRLWRCLGVGVSVGGSAARLAARLAAASSFPYPLPLSPSPARRGKIFAAAPLTRCSRFSIICPAQSVRPYQVIDVSPFIRHRGEPKLIFSVKPKSHHLLATFSILGIAPTDAFFLFFCHSLYCYNSVCLAAAACVSAWLMSMYF